MARSCWRVNELEYFEAPAASALMFHDFYPDGRQSGLEIIQHGERIAANGDLRLAEWRFPKVGKRTVYARRRGVRVEASFPEAGVDYTVRVEADGDSLRVHARYRAWMRHDGVAWPSFIEFGGGDGALSVRCKIERARFRERPEPGRLVVLLPAGTDSLDWPGFRRALERAREL